MRDGFIDKVEVLTFVDGEASIDWMLESGAKVMNLLTKGSLNHLTHQLKKTPEAHFADIQKVIELAQSKGISANVYLEDWSNGMRHSQEYVFQYIDFLTTQPVKRIMLPDTLGVLVPSEVFEFISATSRVWIKDARLTADIVGKSALALSVGAGGTYKFWFSLPRPPQG